MTPARRQPFVVISALAALLAVNGIALQLALPRVTSGDTFTIGYHLNHLLHRTQGDDSWEAMSEARAFVETPGRGRLYEELFFRRGRKFQYPPTSLLFIDHLTPRALNTVSWIATVTNVIVAAFLFELSLSRRWPSAVPSTWGATVTLWGIAIGFGLTFYPILHAYSLGQIQAWLNSLFAVVLLAWAVGQPAVGGVGLVVMCLIKPTYVLLLLWGTARRHWRFVAAAAATIAAGAAVSVWRYGLHDHLEYVSVMRFIGLRGEAFYTNQSVNGTLNRLWANGSALVFDQHAFPPLQPWVVAGTTVAGLVGVAALIMPVRAHSADTLIDFSIATLVATMAAPIAWDHHYGVMLAIYAVAVPHLLTRRPAGPWTIPALTASYVLSSNLFEFTKQFAATPFAMFESYLLGGALILVVLLSASMRTAQSPSVETEALSLKS